MSCVARFLSLREKKPNLALKTRRTKVKILKGKALVIIFGLIKLFKKRKYDHKYCIKIDSFFRFLTYLKIFLGMGFLWSMEIIGGLVDDNVHESSW